MTWTIHWLKTMLLVSLLYEENIFTVFKVMAACLPKLRTINVWRKNFAISSDFVLGSHEIYESIVDDSSVREKQGAAWRHGSEIEEALLWADSSVVSFQ